VIGTVLTTLHVGSIVLTIFPNYNISLKDPILPQRMKVQIQITGAKQVSEAHSATLHHQIIYRLQNHVVNLSMPTSHDSALFILVNNQEETPSIVQISKNISIKELQELIPLQWVTNYEKLRENIKPLTTSQATFRRFVDGLVTITFKGLDGASSSNPHEVFHSLMIKPKVKEDNRMPIFVVKADGW